jgi:type III secretion protein Y
MDRDQRDLLLCLAYLYLTAGREHRALALLDVVEQAAPADPAMLRMLAHTLIETDDPGRAVDLLDRLEQIEGDSPGLLLLRSRALHRLGRRAEAQAIFQVFVEHRAGTAPLELLA